jgi:hypothetical protein
MTELIRGGKGTISLHGCSSERPHFYKKTIKIGKLWNVTPFGYESNVTPISNGRKT